MSLDLPREAVAHSLRVHASEMSDLHKVRVRPENVGQRVIGAASLWMALAGPHALDSYESVAALYAEKPIYLPVTGGILKTRQGVRLHYAQSGMNALDVPSVRLETMSDTLLFDTGTFTATLCEEVGGRTSEREYGAVSRVKENRLQIRSLTALPKRQAPGAPDQE